MRQQITKAEDDRLWHVLEQLDLVKRNLEGEARDLLKDAYGNIEKALEVPGVSPNGRAAKSKKRYEDRQAEIAGWEEEEEEIPDTVPPP